MGKYGTQFLLSVLALAILFPADSPAVDQPTAVRIARKIEEINAEVIRIRRYLHMNPELANQEVETAKLVASRLFSLGMEVRTGIANTGVTGLLRGEEPGWTIALRADMDALPVQEKTGLPYASLNPGVMHACGHDIHTSVALGTAMVLSSLRDRLKGNIRFIFQPAEEGDPQHEGGGAEGMVREGVLENPPVRAILAFHVWPEDVGQVFFASGPLLASSDWFEIRVLGKSAHGARPHEGIDAVNLASQIVVTLQSIISRSLDPTDPAVLTIGRIEGGTKANILADQVTLEGTVRTLSRTNREKIPRLIEEITRAVARSFGASYTFQYRKGPPPLYNHPDLASILVPTLERVAGKDQVRRIKPQMVSEDFSFFCRDIPGFYFFLGVKNPEEPSMAPLHSPFFKPDERSIPLGIKIMCHLLLDCLEQQRNLEGTTDR